jgi:hypothetical protein
MSDVKKSDFGHVGQIEARIAIANSLRSPHAEKLAFFLDPQHSLLEGRQPLQEL